MSSGYSLIISKVSNMVKWLIRGVTALVYATLSLVCFAVVVAILCLIVLAVNYRT